MKTTGNSKRFAGLRGCMVLLFVWVALAASWATAATEYFVKPDGDDGADGLSWATALASPQVALDKVVAGDTITVTNGTFVLDRGGASGATVVLALDVDKDITLRSVEGATQTIIDGQGDNSGRIQIMRISAAGAVVEGFTLQNGWTWQTIAGVEISAGTLRDSIVRGCFNRYDVGSGATLSMSGSALVERCILTDNETERRSPVALLNSASATLRNCLFYGNRIGTHGTPSLSYSGGNAAVVEVRNGTMQHVTIAYNSGIDGGVTGLLQTGGTVANSIVYHNRHVSLPMTDMFNDENVYKTGGTLTHSIISPLLAGTGNLNAGPRFIAPLDADFRLAPGSPAIDAGDDLGVDDDLSGNPRPLDGNGDSVAAPDMGAYEAPTAGAGALRVAFASMPSVAVGAGQVTFTAESLGADPAVTEWDWDFGNGQTSDAAGPHTITYNEPGAYTVRVEASNAGSETAVWSNIVYRAPETIYASATGDNVFPFDTLQKATPDIQRAIDAAAVSATATSGVRVADGTYTRAQYAPLVLNRAITVQSLYGSADAKLTAVANTRIVEINHAGAILSGFTVTNANITYSAHHSKGGGIWLENGTVYNCRIVGNRNAHAGGIQIVNGLVDRCVIAGNTAHTTWDTHAAGGGVNMLGGTLRNSLVMGNTVLDGHVNTSGGGGISMHSAGGPRVENCTVVDNVIPDGHIGGGIMRRHAGAVVVNTIVWNNHEESGTANNIQNSGTIDYANVTYTAAPELDHDPDGTGNLSDITAPGFVDGDAGNYRLTEQSPCVNAGTTAGIAWITLAGALDLDGNPRLVGARPELGAYEFIPPKGTLIMLQ